MNNFSRFIAVASVMATSSVALAAPITGNPITPNNDCALLAEQVTLNLSTNVIGAYNCDVPNTRIDIGACHQSGSRKPLVVACQATGVDAQGNNIYNDASCDGTPQQTFTIANYRGYEASTSGGSVGATDLGGSCTATTAQALVD